MEILGRKSNSSFTDVGHYPSISKVAAAVILVFIEFFLLFGQIEDHGFSDNAIFLTIVVFATLVVGGVLITVVHSRKNTI